MGYSVLLWDMPEYELQSGHFSFTIGNAEVTVK